MLGNTSILMIIDMIPARNYFVSTAKRRKKTLCEIPVKTKNTEVSFNTNLIERLRATKVYAEACVPIQHQMLEGFKYLIVMMPAPHRYMDVRFVRSKAKVQNHRLNFTAWSDRHLRKTVKQQERVQ